MSAHAERNQFTRIDPTDATMEFETKKYSSLKASKLLELNLYIDPPMTNIRLDEAEDFFRQRLEAMSVFDTYNERKEHIDVLEAALKNIKSHVYKVNCVDLVLPTTEQKRQDNISHFLSRLHFSMYPEDSEHIKRFKSFERRLLLARLRKVNCFDALKLASFLDIFDFEYELVPQKEVEQLAEKNYIGCRRQVKERINRITEAVFRVKFEHALSFVDRRTVGVLDGFALLTRNEIMNVICDVFEHHIDTSIQQMRGSLNVDASGKYLMNSLQLVHTDIELKDEERRKRLKANRNDLENNPMSIDIDYIDEIAVAHYPPCMRGLHDSLRRDHHLKHGGRIQYGTFLRSCGVDLDSAIKFWRTEFTNRIDNTKFERDYKYNIRHLYGKEGHKKALSCFSCQKIISDSTGVGDNHGCPFKHYEEKNLRMLLKKYSVNEVDIESLISTSKNQKDYTKACSDYFKVTHGNLPSEPIRNPAQYYYESKRFVLTKPESFIKQDGDCQMNIDQSDNKEDVPIVNPKDFDDDWTEEL